MNRTKKPERTVLGATNKPKGQEEEHKQARPEKFSPQEPSSANASQERLLQTTKSSESATKPKSPQIRESEAQSQARTALHFHAEPSEHKRQHVSQVTSSSVQLHPDPNSQLYQPDNERFVTTKERPNERVDAHEMKLRRQRDAAHLDLIRQHETEITESLQEREKRTSQKEEARVSGIQHQREGYERAVGARRERDSRATGSHDVSVQEALHPSDE